MNLSNQGPAENNTNVVSLFSRSNIEGIISDPMAELLDEGRLEDFMLNEDEVIETIFNNRKVVDENQFPDQSIYVLEEQLSNLRSNLNRIKFYLGDMDDLLVR